MLYCLEGRAVVECNFRSVPLRKGDVLLVFSDTLFSMEKRSPGFRVRHYELSAALTDETTFNSGGAFLDWLTEYPVFHIDSARRSEIEQWFAILDHIESDAVGKYKNMMLRNHWHNFFLGLESVLQPALNDNEIKSISSYRTIFDSFCKLLCENCRIRHDVKFYADRLCITPYYLSKVTNRIFRVAPKELIDRQIVMEIKSLLTSTQMSVKEIATHYNFESSSYLGRYFRRHTGMTPSEYRAAHC